MGDDEFFRTRLLRSDEPVPRLDPPRNGRRPGAKRRPHKKRLREWLWNSSRQSVGGAWMVRCRWCGGLLWESEMTMDRWPQCGHLGGGYNRGNVVPACSPCNASRCCYPPCSATPAPLGPPPPHFGCTAHLGRPDPSACVFCADARSRWERWSGGREAPGRQLLAALQARVERLERTYAGVAGCPRHIGNQDPGCPTCAEARALIDDRRALCEELAVRPGHFGRGNQDEMGRVEYSATARNSIEAPRSSAKNGAK